ncbi:3775_t:CDS:2, partial [Entrophospora sp. SA101]
MRARIFQVTKCSACRGSLDLPAVHFLCRHSFHQRCLPETDRECPQCAIQNREILEIRRSQEICADKHELFFDMLEKAEDGFSVIAEYFSKNTMAFAK